MDAVYKGANWARRRAVAIVVAVLAATLLAGGAFASSAVTQPYFGTARTSAGYIPGL